MKSKITLLDGVMWLAGIGFLAIVLYRYRSQQYFDLYGLLMLGMCVLIYRQYRIRPKKNEPQSNRISAHEKKA